MVNLLLNKGANINAFDKKDGRPLHWAAFMGKSHSQVVEYVPSFILMSEVLSLSLSLAWIQTRRSNTS